MEANYLRDPVSRNGGRNEGVGRFLWVAGTIFVIGSMVLGAEVLQQGTAGVNGIIVVTAASSGLFVVAAGIAALCDK